MKEIIMSSKTLLSNFKFHEQLKHDLLLAIDTEENAKSDFSSSETDPISINKLDWHISRDFENRNWVKIIYDKLNLHFIDCADKLGYQDVKIWNLWFQQYIKNDTHPWHIHSANYTGVYYLEFPKGSPSTEIIDHSNKVYKVNPNEGDIIIFPSFFIHRSPNVQLDLQKTIISFNLDFLDVNMKKTN